MSTWTSARDAWSCGAKPSVDRSPRLVPIATTTSTPSRGSRGPTGGRRARARRARAGDPRGTRPCPSAWSRPGSEALGDRGAGARGRRRPRTPLPASSSGPLRAAQSSSAISSSVSVGDEAAHRDASRRLRWPADLRGRDVDRQRHHDRTSAARECGRDRAAQQVRQRAGRRDLDGELGDVARHLDDLQAVRGAVLQHALAVRVARDLADEEQHGHAIAPRGGEAGHRVEHAGTRGHGDDAELAGRARVRRRRRTSRRSRVAW